MSNIGNTPPPGIGSLTLNNFVEAAQSGPQIIVTQDGREFEVLAQGNTPETGRRVDWVKSNRGDATGLFLQTLSADYSNELVNAIAKELRLEPAPGKPLSSRAVEQAVQMADTAKIAMEGVNFLDELFRK